MNEQCIARTQLEDLKNVYGIGLHALSRNCNLDIRYHKLVRFYKTGSPVLYPHELKRVAKFHKAMVDLNDFKNSRR